MAQVASAEEEPKRWKLRDALKLKAKQSGEVIERIFADADELDLIEVAMSLEEEYGIEIDIDEWQELI